MDPPGGFDLSALSSVLNDPSIRGMAEQIANNPAFAQMTSALQETLLQGGGAGDAAAAAAQADPARYAEAMSSVLGNPEFMNMAERLGQQIMNQDPGMAALMQTMQTPGSQVEVERRLTALKADPALAPILAEIEEGGPAAMMKYWDDPVTLEKLSKAMGSAFGVGPEGGAVADGNAAGEAAAQEEEAGPPTILDLASNGDCDGIAALLDGKSAEEAAALVATTDDEGRTALHFASGYGEEAVVRALLAAGAAVDAPDGQGNTPLHFAAGYDQPAIVTILLGAGAAAAAVNGDGKTAAETAAVNGVSDGVVDLFGPELAAAARATAAEEKAKAEAAAAEADGGEEEGGEEAEETKATEATEATEAKEATVATE